MREKSYAIGNFAIFEHFENSAAAFSSFECNQINVINDPRPLAFLNRTPYTLKPYTFNRKTRSAPFPPYGLVFFQVRAANLQKTPHSPCTGGLKSLHSPNIP